MYNRARRHTVDGYTGPCEKNGTQAQIPWEVGGSGGGGGGGEEEKREMLCFIIAV